MVDHIGRETDFLPTAQAVISSSPRATSSFTMLYTGFG